MREARANKGYFAFWISKFRLRAVVFDFERVVFGEKGLDIIKNSSAEYRKQLEAKRVLALR